MSIQKKKAEKASSFKGCAINEWQILVFWDLTTVRWLPWELLDCLNIADDCLAPAWWLPWHLPDDCLMTTYLCTYVMTTWQLPDAGLPDDFLATHWWLPDHCLMSAWNLPEDYIHISQLKLCILWQTRKRQRKAQVYEDARSLKNI